MKNNTFTAIDTHSINEVSARAAASQARAAQLKNLWHGLTEFSRFWTKCHYSDKAAQVQLQGDTSKLGKSGKLGKSDAPSAAANKKQKLRPLTADLQQAA